MLAEVDLLGPAHLYTPGDKKLRRVAPWKLSDDGSSLPAPKTPPSTPNIHVCMGFDLSRARPSHTIGAREGKARDRGCEPRNVFLYVHVAYLRKYQMG